MVKKSLLKKIFLFCISFCSFCFIIFADEKLGNLNTSWSAVIPGEVIAEPAITSYGFAVATDGKLISAFSNDGVPLWEKSTRSSRNVTITALPEDFIILWDKRYKELKLLNPSGGEIWTKKLNFTLNNQPFAGRDGRFFITGDKIIECYGINGIRKWSLETPNQRELQLQELPDGSIILFLNEKDGKTQAVRISPFGKILEEITFAGEIKNAFTTKDGVFLIFTDGSAGMFSIDMNSFEGLSKNKWVINNKSNNSTLVIGNNSYLYLELYNNKVIVHTIDSKSGAIIKSFTINNINGLDIRLKKITNGGLFIADSINCYLYSLTGIKKWSAVMPENKGSGRWNYLIYTNDNHLIFCHKNWSINAYLTAQGLKKQSITKSQTYFSYYKIDVSPYSFLFTEQLDRNVVGLERYNNLLNGDYGEDEIMYCSQLYSLFTAYLNAANQQLGVGRKNLSVFDKDSFGMEGAFNQLSLIGTKDASNYFSKILSTTTNNLYLSVLFDSVGKCGYDPDGKILKQLGLIIPRINHKEINLLESACDAVYSICLFMGRPAYNRMGKEILKELMYPKYDRRTIDYVGKTLEKIMAIEL